MYKKYTKTNGVAFRLCYKIMPLMRLITLLLIVTTMHVSASSLAQEISIIRTNATLISVLKDIKAQTGYKFVYRDELMNQAKLVSINANRVSVEELLKRIFDKQNLSFSIDNNVVIVKEKEKPFLGKVKDIILETVTFNANLNGHVSDSLGKPLIGAFVILKGKVIYTAITDKDGSFKFPSVLAGKYKLSSSYVGFEKLEQEITVQDIYLSGEINIVMRISTSELDLVQIIAYGKQSKRFNIGSTGTITAETIEKQSLSNVLLALQGQVPGLSVNSDNGAPGGGVRVQIRGQNTLSNSPTATPPFDQPLFIVDGVPFAPQNQPVSKLNSLNGIGSNNIVAGINPFSTINALDIESVTVLKDADATSIYGSQGANGVILITTKKGKPGKVTFNISVKTSVNNPTRTIKLLNTEQYLIVRQDAIKNDGIILPSTYAGQTQYADVLLFDRNKYTNWFKDFFIKSAYNSDIYGNVSGGSLNSTFIISAGYNKNSLNFPGNFSENRYNIHTAFHQSLLENKMEIDFGSDYSYTLNNSASLLSIGAPFLPPNFPNLLDQNGKLIWDYKGYKFQEKQYYANLREPYKIEAGNFSNNLQLKYKILSGLDISANIGYSRFSSNENKQTPRATISPFLTFLTSNSAFSKTDFETINIEPVIDYRNHIANGELTSLIGGTFKENITNNQSVIGNDYFNDALLGSLAGARIITGKVTKDQYKYVGFFARLNYIYDKKYIVNFTGRRDGSSNFSPGRQFGNFASTGLGWIFSEEGIFKENISFISYAKLSGNYGSNGSDGIAPYQYQGYWTGNVYGTSFQGTGGVTQTNIFNTDNYSWASKKTLNFSFDLGLFRDRILLNTTWYNSRTSNQLVSTILPDQTGFSSVPGNFNATLQNSGLEFSLSSRNINQINFKWRSQFNIGFNRNKLIAFEGLKTSAYAATYAIGKSTNVIYGYRYKGVNSQTGIYEFYKADGTITSAPNGELTENGGDQQIIADLQPKFGGGFNNELEYRHFSLSFFFQFSKQVGISYLRNLSGIFGTGGENLPASILGHYWRKPGDRVQIQQPTTGFGTLAALASQSFGNSDGVYSDASYIRLKNVSIYYSIHSKFLDRKGFNIKFSVSAQNLFTVTPYQVGDPETSGNIKIIPIQRVVSFGLNLKF